MEESFVIILPLPAKVLYPNKNVGSLRGRILKAKATKTYRQKAADAISEEDLQSSPWPKVRVDAVLFYEDSRRRDSDNAMGALKSVYDGIVDSGLVPDDDPEHMKRTQPTFAKDACFPRIELTLTKLEES